MNFKWAMVGLQQNQRVRRAAWPQETIKAGTVIPDSDGDYTIRETFTRRWHLFMQDGYLGQSFWEAGIINGWGDSVGGAADDDPVRNGMVYSATDADRQADDWELLS